MQPSILSRLCQRDGPIFLHRERKLSRANTKNRMEMPNLPHTCVLCGRVFCPDESAWRRDSQDAGTSECAGGSRWKDCFQERAEVEDLDCISIAESS
jgi:hypothetical protein